MQLPIPLSPSSLFLLIAAVLITSSTAATDTSFIYVQCSQTKYPPATQYSTNVDAALTSILTAATSTAFNNFTSGPVHALFQCRPDLPSSACAACVSHSLTQLASLCADSLAVALMLDGCFVRYDNASFFGVEDKSLVVKKCGPQMENEGDSGELTRLNSVLGYLASGRELFRVGGSGGVSGVAECVGDLTAEQCGVCLAEAIGRLRSECGPAASWGDVFLAKCYARYSFSGMHASGNTGSSQNDETQKTLAILIGLIAVVALITIFAAFLRKACEEKGGK